MLDTFRLEGEIEKLDSLWNRAFSIISCRASISSLYLVCVDIMAVAIVEVIVLEIEYCITGSIAGGDMEEVSSWNCDIASD